MPLLGMRSKRISKAHVRIAHTRVWVASMRPPRDAAADLTSA